MPTAKKVALGESLSSGAKKVAKKAKKAKGPTRKELLAQVEVLEGQVAWYKRHGRSSGRV